MGRFSFNYRLAAVAVGLIAVGAPVYAQARAAGPCTSQVAFSLKAGAPLPEEPTGKLQLRRVDREEEPLAFTAKVGSPVTAQLPCRTQWEVTPVFRNAWGPRATLTVPEAAGILPTAIALWPLGRIAGSVRLPEKGEKFPKSLTVVTLAPRTPAQRELPKGFLDCPIGPQGRWACAPLPAATFDLVLSAEGFVPQYLWAFKVAAGKTRDLGTVELKRGSAVAGWVEVEGGAIDAACTARLVPSMAAGGGDVRIAEKLERTAGKVRVRKDGFFQLVGIAPGSYTLEIRQPGFAPASVRPIEVWPRRETFLREPVALKKPLRLEVAIEPPLDWLGHPWRVLVFKASEESASFDRDPVFQGTADEYGLALIADQAPGRFQVHISDSLENRLFSKVFRIAGPEEAHQDVRLEVLTVYGSIKLGKEPLAATLWFGGRYGSSSVRLDSDREGKFQGVLPRDGWWRVDVASVDPAFETKTKVQVETNRQDRSRVEILLPSTRAFGKVLDDEGRPAPGAEVSFSTDDGDLLTTADDLGRFEVRGLQEGQAFAAAALSSTQGLSTSERISLLLHEGEDVGPIELRLRKGRAVSGAVRSSRGPVPGAGVVVLPLRPTMMFGASARTGLDGTFVAQVPASTQAAVAIVSPPGHALRAFPLDLGSAAPRSLEVGDESGRLDLALPEKPRESELDEMSLWVFQNGLPLPMDVLGRWSAGHGKAFQSGERLAVPELAPGEYRACLAARAVLAQWQSSGFTAPLAKCAAGQLSAGGTLELDLSRP